MELKEILNMIVESERRGGELILAARDIIAENKTDARNVVTEYDRFVQDLMIEKFRENLSGAHFFCEENDLCESLDAEHVFIIDPIDGTANFVHGFHHSSISCAYASKGEVKAAAIYNPYINEMFTAIKGEGAFLNGKRIFASDAGISESIALVGTAPYYPDIEEDMFRVMKYAYDKALDIRREGSAALDLCAVASGRTGFFVELRLSYWDYAAGALIVKEAGGEACACSGKPLPATGEKSSVLAGSKKAVNEFLKDFPNSEWP